MSATVIGFGSRTPAKVLELLAESVKQYGITTIIPQRSQKIEMALLEAPYRTFLSSSASSSFSSSEKTKNLIIYALPVSLSEYILAGTSESNHVRNKAIESLKGVDSNDIVITYNVKSDSFMGASSSSSSSSGKDEILSQLIDNTKKFASATLSALSTLDDLASKYYSNPNHGDTVMVVGSGGREHALAVALAKSPLVSTVLCCPGNGGTAAEESDGKIQNIGSGQDNTTVIQLVKDHNVDMVVVGPEQPLVDGLVDELAKQCPDVKAFGPSQAAAQLEASKAFSKDFLEEHDIPTASYRNFTDASEAINYVKSLPPNKRVVVKASGLAAGKGVLLPQTPEETIEAVHEIMSDKAFGSAGDTCVIESFLIGPEASCLAFCDGVTAKLMPAAQDHKRALDGDQGLNTGGMGAYAPAPCVTEKLQREIEAMCQKTVQKMAERGTPYVGILYAGMMLTPDGPYVLEFNCRFGDPETQVVLPLLETDLYEVFTACCTSSLDTVDVRFKEETSAATVVCAAMGYPKAYPKGMKITGLSNANLIDNVKVYHAGTKLDQDLNARCSGGRVLAVTGMGKDLSKALNAAYKGVNCLSFVSDEGNDKLMHFRTDIAKKATQKKLRIGIMGSTRGSALVPVIEACAKNSVHAEIVAVLSNKSSAPILDKGRALGVTVTTKFVSSKGLSREQYDAECTSVLVQAGVEVVLLIGYMRILSKGFTDFWNNSRCLNVHPSLLPKYAGGMDLAVHQAVIDAKESETGCTIHEVTEEVDGGPIVVQKVVKVQSDDTAESLKSRVQPLEGPAFIEAIATYCQKHKIGVIIEQGALTYADAGVDITAGNNLVEMIKPMCKSTIRPGCDADLGGFGGLFDLTAAGFGHESSNPTANDTILIGATDGVGTKLRIAQATNIHDTVGIDLVAMCVNDLIVAGGEPLFFLDYYATGKLQVEEAAAVVKGIAEGCRQANCGLVGGETAEMPSMYKAGDYDLAGFSVGAVPRDGVLPSKNICAGDVLLGLASSGIHSNGFSLVRKLIERAGLTYNSPCPWEDDKTVGESLLTPTKIYVKSCVPLLKAKLLKGLAHITGGGLLENLPRSLPKGVTAEIYGHPPLPKVFQWIKEISKLDDQEMLRTFNCGVGMVLIVPKDKVDEAKSLLQDSNDTVYDLGVLVEADGEQIVMKSNLS